MYWMLRSRSVRLLYQKISQKKTTNKLCFIRIGSKTDFCAMRCRSFTCMSRRFTTLSFSFEPFGQRAKKRNRTYQDQCAQQQQKQPATTNTMIVARRTCTIHRRAMHAMCVGRNTFMANTPQRRTEYMPIRARMKTK